MPESVCGGQEGGQKGKGLLWKKHNERKKNKMENLGYFKAKELKKKLKNTQPVSPFFTSP